MEVTAVANTTTVTTVDGENNNSIETLKKNRIQVSNTKKPLFFYLNLAKKYIKQHDDIVLSALGMAIPTVITIAGILKTHGLVTEKDVFTSTVGTKDDAKGRMVQKPKIEIVLGKKVNVEKMNPTAGEEPKEDAAKKENIEKTNTTARDEPKKETDQLLIAN